MVDVSVILINYNTLQFTLQCIKSIYQNSTGFTNEVILIDNASEGFNSDDIADSFPLVKIISNRQNVGFAKANNQGIKLANGKYILLLNNDTRLIENSIKKCLDVLRANEQTGVVSAKLIYPDGTPQHCVNTFPSITNELLELFRLTKLFSSAKRAERYLGRFYNYNCSSEVPWVWATFFLFPRSLLSSLPERKLSDDYFMYYEDVLWCYQIRQAGYRIYYNGDTKVIHHLSQSLGSTTNKKHTLIMENERRFVKAYKGSLYAFFFFLTKALVHLTQGQPHLRKLGFQYLRKAFS